MNKRFNVTGVCIPKKHYMVDIKYKLDSIKKMIDRGDYFVINRPRQYGKTTTMYLLEQRLLEKYLVISCSFEGIGDSVFQNEESFSSILLKLFSRSIKMIDKNKYQLLENLNNNLTTLEMVSDAITEFIMNCDKEVILFIDEVDKSSNNQLFLSFIGMLRNKYLLREQGKDYTFHSVILAGVHDIKNLKLKLRPDDERKYNSPWNIAVNFNVDMSFNPREIETMLEDYEKHNNVVMDKESIANKLYYYTNGYPFLVSRLCQIVDEELLNQKEKLWIPELIDISFKLILKENNTLFDDLIKNLENNKTLFNFIERIILLGEQIAFMPSEPTISLGITYGIICNKDNRCIVNNKIFEHYIYNHMSIKKIVENETMSRYNYKNNFLTIDNGLDFKKILLKFQQFMKEQYSHRDEKFIEREGRLLFLAFIKPIINGIGFDFKEVQISEEKRLDVVVTYESHKYIAELKIWYGEEYHKKGLAQLVEYLNIQGLDKGYLLIYDFNKDKEYKHETAIIDDKEIFMVWV